MECIIHRYGYKEGLATVGGVITEWPYDFPVLTPEEIVALEVEYQAAIAYRKAREIAYTTELGSELEQLDFMCKYGLDALKTKRQAIKDRFPKPTV